MLMHFFQVVSVEVFLPVGRSRVSQQVKNSYSQHQEKSGIIIYIF